MKRYIVTYDCPRSHVDGSSQELRSVVDANLITGELKWISVCTDGKPWWALPDNEWLAQDAGAHAQVISLRELGQRLMEARRNAAKEAA